MENSVHLNGVSVSLMQLFTALLNFATAVVLRLQVLLKKRSHSKR